MKNKLENIEEVFKQSFDGFEANIDPSVWANVQSGIGVNSAATTTSIVGKSMALKIVAGAITVGVIATGVYFAPNSLKEKEVIITENVAKEVSSEKILKVETTKTIEENNIEKEVSIINKVENSIEESVATKEITNIEEQVAEVDGNAKSPIDNEQNASTNENANNETNTVEETDETAVANVLESTEKSTQTESSVPEETEEQKPVAPVKKEVVLDIIPNVITPNGDGQNDVIKITGENLERVEIVILDKTLATVYKIQSLDDEWNGKNQGGYDLLPGTYYMVGSVVDSNGTVKEIKQIITLFK